VACSGRPIIIVQFHCDLSSVENVAMSGVHHWPSSGMTRASTESGRRFRANRMV